MNNNTDIMKKSGCRTDFLFAKSSFLLGVGSLVSIFSGYYTFNTSETEYAADMAALKSDFGTIGQDLYTAVKSL